MQFLIPNTQFNRKQDCTNFNNIQYTTQPKVVPTAIPMIIDSTITTAMITEARINDINISKNIAMDTPNY